MPDYSALRSMFEGIRDERRTAANTAVRIGNAFLALLDMLGNLGLDDKYLSKVSDDAAEGVITFLKGLLIGDGTSSPARMPAAASPTAGASTWMPSRG